MILTSTPTTNSITFDSVQLNDGGHSDSSKGEFTCPVNSIYFLSMLMASTPITNPCKAQLKQNSDVIAEARMRMREGALMTNGMISGSATAYCVAGDTVYVEVNDYANLTSVHPGMTTFSGVILNID